MPVGILDFCKQKFLAPPMKPLNHLKRGKSCNPMSHACGNTFNSLNKNKKEKTKQ